MLLFFRKVHTHTHTAFCCLAVNVITRMTDSVSTANHIHVLFEKSHVIFASKITFSDPPLQRSKSWSRSHMKATRTIEKWLIPKLKMMTIKNAGNSGSKHEL